MFRAIRFCVRSFFVLFGAIVAYALIHIEPHRYQEFVREIDVPKGWKLYTKDQDTVLPQGVALRVVPFEQISQEKEGTVHAGIFQSVSSRFMVIYVSKNMVSYVDPETLFTEQKRFSVRDYRFYAKGTMVALSTDVAWRNSHFLVLLAGGSWFFYWRSLSDRFLLFHFRNNPFLRQDVVRERQIKSKYLDYALKYIHYKGAPCRDMDQEEVDDFRWWLDRSIDHQILHKRMNVDPFPEYEPLKSIKLGSKPPLH